MSIVHDIPTESLRAGSVSLLSTPDELHRLLPREAGVAAHVDRSRQVVRDILAGRDPRLLVVAGPCSVDDVAAAEDYAAWLADAAAPLSDALFVVMRAYFEKPRTQAGWQGFVDDPLLDDSGEVERGMVAARRLLTTINQMGLAAATEFTDVTTPLYLGDLVTWVAVGARTVESPPHRQLASGLACPVGFKNGTSGEVQVAINAVAAARVPQRLIGITPDGHPAVISTSGNPDGHVILRGGTAGTNYDVDSIRRTAAALQAAGLPHRLMVDFAHGNCAGDYRRQVDVCRHVAGSLATDGDSIMGVMFESALIEGCQPVNPAKGRVYGQSVTDACIGLVDSARVLEQLAEAVMG